jgi:hypothetical protein
MSDMDESQLQDSLAITVAMIADELTDAQLKALNLCVLLDMNPHGRLFDYAKVAPLFTEQDGTRMHDATKAELARVIAERFGGAR